MSRAGTPALRRISLAAIAFVAAAGGIAATVARSQDAPPFPPGESSQKLEGLNVMIEMPDAGPRRPSTEGASSVNTPTIRRAACLGAVLLLAAGCHSVSAAVTASQMPTAAPPRAPEPQIVHCLVPKHSGLMLGIREGRQDEGADAIQWTDTGGPEQKWVVVPAADGCVRFRAVHSGKFLAVAYPGIEKGARVVQTADGDCARALWRLVPCGGEWFQIVAQSSEQYLAVALANRVRGEIVIQWTDSGGDEQRWRLGVVPRE